MTWTTQQPTQPGWYWWRWRNDKDPEIVRISTGADNRLWMEEMENYPGATSLEKVHGQFAGPIPEPGS